VPITGPQFADIDPFKEVEFEFDEHVNVFVGPNNSGKSTVLTVLAEIFIVPFDFPEKLLLNDIHHLFARTQRLAFISLITNTDPLSDFSEKLIEFVLDRTKAHCSITARYLEELGFAV